MAALATGIRSVYQPIVRLADRRVIAYEALARGPAGSPLERPDALFAAARAEGLETALDWECWRAALRGALESGLGPDRALFVNVEPSSATSWVPEIGDPLLEDALDRFPLVVELTERALAQPRHRPDPAGRGPAPARRPDRPRRRRHRPPLARPDALPAPRRDQARPQTDAQQPLAGDRRGRPRGQRRGGADRGADPRRGDRDRGAPAAGAGARRLLRPGLALRPSRRAAPRPRARRRRRSSRCAATRRRCCPPSAPRSRSSPPNGRCAAPTSACCSS